MNGFCAVIITVNDDIEVITLLGNNSDTKVRFPSGVRGPIFSSSFSSGSAGLSSPWHKEMSYLHTEHSSFTQSSVHFVSQIHSASGPVCAKAVKEVISIMTTSSVGGLLCGYKPVVLAGSKEPLKIRHAHSYHRQALKGFSLCLIYWLTRKRVYVLFQ